MLRPFPGFGLLALAAAPAEAQSLAYADLTDAAPEQRETEEASADGSPRLHYALIDRFEWSPKGDGYAWDFSALFGNDRDRLYLGSSGEGAFAGRLDYLELDAFYSRNLGGGDWDLNFGLRYDILPRPSRAYAALGAQYDDDKLWFGAWTYLSHKGEASARLAAYYNWQVAGPLYLQPAVELDIYGQDVPALGIGRGFAYAEAGLRLRYEIREYLAPYLGFTWSRDLGRTARFDRAAGEDPEAKGVVLGVRSSF